MNKIIERETQIAKELLAMGNRRQVYWSSMEGAVCSLLKIIRGVWVLVLKGSVSFEEEEISRTASIKI